MNRWLEKLEELPEDASLQAKLEAVIYCGRLSGEHKPDKEYYCCEKVDAIIEILRMHFRGGLDGKI